MKSLCPDLFCLSRLMSVLNWGSQLLPLWRSLGLHWCIALTTLAIELEGNDLFYDVKGRVAIHNIQLSTHWWFCYLVPLESGGIDQYVDLVQLYSDMIFTWIMFAERKRRRYACNTGVHLLIKQFCQWKSCKLTIFIVGHKCIVFAIVYYYIYTCV